jgi:hypothetical protein
MYRIYKILTAGDLLKINKILSDPKFGTVKIVSTEHANDVLFVIVRQQPRFSFEESNQPQDVCEPLPMVQLPLTLNDYTEEEEMSNNNLFDSTSK